MTIKGFKATTNHKRFIMEDLLELVFQLFLRNKSKGILCWQPQFLIRGYQRKTFDVLLPRGYAFFAGAASHVVFARRPVRAFFMLQPPHRICLIADRLAILLSRMDTFIAMSNDMQRSEDPAVALEMSSDCDDVDDDEDLDEEAR
jgi:hypothetical protein